MCMIKTPPVTYKWRKWFKYKWTKGKPVLRGHIWDKEKVTSYDR